MPSTASSVPWPVPRQGVRADLHPVEVPAEALRDGRNWLRRNGRFVIRPGLRPLGDPLLTSRCHGFMQYNHEDEDDRILAGTGRAWHRWDTSTEAWVQIPVGSAGELSGGPTSHVQFRTFKKGDDTFVIGVNGTDVPRAWDGDTAAAYRVFGGTPIIATAIAVAYDRVLLARGQLIQVSEALDFDLGWGTELELLLAETPGDVVVMREHGNLSTRIYKETSIYTCYAQPGDPNSPFRFELNAADVSGPASAAAICTLPDGSHCYYARSGEVIRFDGAYAQSLGNHIQAYLQRYASREYRGRAWMTFDPYWQEVWLGFVPIGGTNPTAVLVITWPDTSCFPLHFDVPITAGYKSRKADVESIGRLPGTIGEQDGTIGEYAQITGKMLLGGYTGQVWESDGADDNGVAISAWFETGLSNFGSQRYYFTAQEVEWMLAETSAEHAAYGQLSYFNFGEDVQLSSSKAMLLNNARRRRTQHRTTAKAFGLRLSIDAEEPVEFGGATLAVHQRGLR